MTTVNFQTEKTIFIVVAVTALVTSATLLLEQTILADWHWEHFPTHSTVEAVGCVLALWVSIILLKFEKEGLGTDYNIPIASALVAMAILDAFHATASPGQYFVYLHSAATLLGGALFALVLLPHRWLRLLNPRLFAGAIALALVVGLAPVVSGVTPAMFDTTGFTRLANSMNIAAGLLLLAAAAKLLAKHNRRDDTNLFPFVVLCFVASVAALLFPRSDLADFLWWSWHLVRLLAYIVAVYFILRSDLLGQAQERQLRDALKVEVESRKAAEQRATQLLHEMQSKQQQLVRIEKLSTIGSLVGGMAHEINNPLMGLSNYISYTRGKLQPGRPRDMLDSAMQQVERIDRIVKNLLLFSRDKSSAAYATVHLAPVLDRVLKLVEPQLRAADITVERQIPDDLPQLALPADSLEQILVNLLLNARDMVSADGQGRIMVAAGTVESGVFLRVDDNGPGVPDALKFRIFDPFFTTKDPEKGTGLGLSVCSDLADMAEASLTVNDSELLGGASFLLTTHIKPEQDEE